MSTDSEGTRPEDQQAHHPPPEPSTGSPPGTLAGPPAAGRVSNRFLNVLVFVCGSASLGAEITSTRLLSPFFGASTIVWANTIAVVLLALAVGYFIGGKLADRYPHLRGLSTMIAIAAVLFAVIPFAARPFLRASVRLLDHVSAGTFVGSLISVIVLVAIPMVLLGAVSPYALRLAIRNVEGSGTVSGRLYAISTAGSLVGIMLAALVLIPFVGSRRTFLFFAIALALVAVVGLGWRSLALPVVLALAAVVPIGALQPDERGARTLYEGETPFQYVRVVQEQEKGKDGDVLLELNQASSVHSMLRPGSYLTGGDAYWDHALVLPLATLDGPPARIAVLGNAAGTLARNIGHFYPDARVDGVEIDPLLTDLGRRFFDMRNPNLRIFHEDARPWLQRTDERYDLIVMDAYQPEYIPFYLATREFFELARDRLTEKGMLLVNIDHPRKSPDLERVLGRTMAEAFPNIRRRTVTFTTTLLMGSRSSFSPERMNSSAKRLDLPSKLIELATPTATHLGPRLPGGKVFTDDRAPVEWLVDLSSADRGPKSKSKRAPQKSATP